MEILLTCTVLWRRKLYALTRYPTMGVVHSIIMSLVEIKGNFGNSENVIARRCSSRSIRDAVTVWWAGE